MVKAVMAGEGRAGAGEQSPELFTDEQWQKLTH